MTNTPNRSPMFKAASLWEHTSSKGSWYLTGRLGGVKVLVFENRARQADDDPSHLLYFTEAPDRRAGGQDHSPQAGDAPASLPGSKTPSAGDDHPEQHRRSPPAGDRVDDRPPWEW